MTRLIQAKQISRYLATMVSVGSFTPAGSTSDTITTVVTTALSSASNSGGSVPLQVGSATQEGVDTATGYNLCKIYVTGSGKVLQDGNGNDVYGKISLAGSTWTLGYFSNVNGTETAFTMPATPQISFDFPYIFSLADFPFRGINAVSERHVAPDLAAYGYRKQTDQLTVTASNTLSAMSQTYSGVEATLYINNVAYTDKDSSPNFSVTGKAITWNPTNAQFALETADTATIEYTY